MKPSHIRYSQDSIKDTYKDGKKVADTIAGLKDGSINPSEIPQIRLFWKDGKIYSLDNRRLATFQESGRDVPYRMATRREVKNDIEEGNKFSTLNDGVSIRVRRGRG